MKRGQSALEFIMTYGWAIMVVLVMIGALAYFGVLSPKSYLPEKCVATAGINCKDFRVSHNGGNVRIQLTYENKLGKSIQIQSVNATYTRGTVTYSDTSCTAYGTPTILHDRQSQMVCDMGAGSSPGTDQPVTVNLALVYREVEGVYNHVANVQIQTKVQP